MYNLTGNEDYQKKKFRGYLDGNTVIELDYFGMTKEDIEVMFATQIGPVTINTRKGKVKVDTLVWPNGETWYCR